jgi:hypothetical protein
MLTLVFIACAALSWLLKAFGAERPKIEWHSLALAFCALAVMAYLYLGVRL